VTNPNGRDCSAAPGGGAEESGEETQLAHTVLMQLLIAEARGEDGVTEGELVAHLAGGPSSGAPPQDGSSARGPAEGSRWAS
jgi:hypothetical protein